MYVVLDELRSWRWCQQEGKDEDHMISFYVCDMYVTETEEQSNQEMWALIT